MVTGKTFDEVQASGVTYCKPVRGRTVQVPYTYGDYAYDIKCRWISIGSAPTQPDAAQYAAWCDMIESYETACHVYSGDEPLNQRQALKRPDAAEWREAEEAEMRQLSAEGMDCYVLVDRAEAESAVATGDVPKIYRSRFVYKSKPPCNGQPARRKARCVATDHHGESPSEEVFAPVVRHESIRLLCSLAAQYDWDIVQLDIVGAFTTAPLDKPQYVQLPDDWKDRYPGKVMKISKALYGFKFSPQVFHRHLCSAMRNFQCLRADGDGSVFIRRDELGVCIVAAWVDDLTVFGDTAAVNRFRQQISDVEHGGFHVKDYGPPTSILGLEIQRDRTARTLQLTQTLFVQTMAQRFDIPHVKPTTPFPAGARLPDFDEQLPVADSSVLRSLVGSMLWVTNSTRPDCAYHVKELSKHLAKCNPIHIEFARHVAAYLSATAHDGLMYHGKLATEIEGFSDSDWASSSNRRSTTGFVYVHNGAAISWRSKTQRCVAHSSTEAEFRAMSDAVREALFLRTIFSAFTGRSSLNPTPLNEDNMGCIAWGHNPVDFARSKHIDISVSSVREHIQEFKTVVLRYVPTVKQLADVLTKNAVPAVFNLLRRGLLGIRNKFKL